MKYTKKTLEELKKTIDRVAHISQAVSGSVALRNHLDAQARKNGLTDDQHQAAEGLGEKIALFTTMGLTAQTMSSNIQKLIDGSAQNPDELEDQLDRYIDQLQLNSVQITAATDKYFIWDNHDRTPEFNDPAWPMYNMARELDDAGKELEVLRTANGIQKYKDIDRQLEEEMTLLSAMSCDGIDLTQVPVMLQNAKAEADEAKNRLEAQKSAGERQNWKKNLDDANRRISQIPGEIQHLEDQKRSLDNTIAAAGRDLQDLKAVRREYNDIRREIETAGQDVNKFNEDINGMQQELSALTEKTNKSEASYQRIMEAYANRSGSAIDFFWPYVESKEKELRWTQVKELAGQLKDILWQDTLVKDEFLSSIEKNSRRLSDGEPLKNGPKKGELSEENRQRLDRINGLVSQMMKIAPDKALLDDLLVRKDPGIEVGDYLDNLDKGLDELIGASKQDISDNVLYKNTQKKNDEISKRLEELDKNAEKQLKDNFASKKEKKARQKINKNLAKEIVKQNKDIVLDAVNTNELDDLIMSHVVTLTEQAAGDANLDVLQEKRKDSLERVNTLNKKLTDMRSENETKYLPYLLGRQNQELGEHDTFFDNMENAISQAAVQDRNRRDNEITQDIDRLKNELEQQRENVNKYSPDSYKKVLVDAQTDFEKKSREYAKLSTINKHLNVAKELFNEKTEEMKRASESRTKETETIMNGIDAFLRDFDKNKKADHENSDEYKAIKTALEAFKNGEAQEKTPEKLKELLGTLKEKTSAYKVKKNKQWFHWKPTGQRKFRLNQADNIERFCDEHTALIDSMGLDEATRQEIRDFDANRPANNMNAGQFSAVAQEMKEQYDNKISTFKSILLESKNINARKFEGNEQMTDEDRKNIVIDALVNNEVEKELYNFGPENGSFGRHLLDIQHLRDTTRENITKNNTEFINKAVQDSKDNPELSGADISKRKEQYEAGRKFRNFTSFDQDPQQLVAGAGNEMNRAANNNNGVLNNNRAVVPQ
ncbi:MAG: hypothetical protein K6C95_04605 [Lachnospiraceae bacterium]|nr:hypothetical protein [Lachnospiraceae bacterium]